MKPILTSLIMCACMLFVANAQTIVSTSPENKKVILEEFTGIHCVYCPEGHAVAEQILNSHPGNVFAINIHQGGYAVPSGSEPDFRTPFGDAIAGQTGLTGYPAGTVNRHNFPGREMGNPGTTALGRGDWAVTANQVLAQGSYVNVGVEAEVTISGRLLTVHVEAYYTGNSPQSTNYLNVALLQNNTRGPQTGGNAGNNYNHMRRLVYLLTGQWGEEITTTTTGSFINRTYTYEIPVSYNNIFADIQKFEVVAYMTETTQEIISGNGAQVEVIPTTFQNDLAVLQIKEISPQCTGNIQTTATIMNVGLQPITSATVSYYMNGGTEQQYEWTGNLEPFEYDEIELEFSDFEIMDENTVSVTVENDDNNDNNTKTTTFSPINSNLHLNLTIQTDDWGDECSWNIKNSAGEIVEEGGNYGYNQTYQIPIELTENDCYTFNLMDSYGDGGCQISLVDDGGTVVYATSGNYGEGSATDFHADDILGISEADASLLQIYPNPSNGIFNISVKSAGVTYEVYDLAGRKIKPVSILNRGTNTIDLNGCGKGTFVVKITDGRSVVSKKIIIK